MKSHFYLIIVIIVIITVTFSSQVRVDRNQTPLDFPRVDRGFLSLPSRTRVGTTHRSQDYSEGSQSLRHPTDSLNVTTITPMSFVTVL